VFINDLNGEEKEEEMGCCRGEEMGGGRNGCIGNKERRNGREKL
jgi:hypothetical protein